MKEEKKIKQNNKIRSFSIGQEEILDPEMDELLRRELMREADDLEEKLNSDPKLVGVGASDDLFASIVGTLKEQGIWEEEEAEPEEEKELEKLYQMLPEEDRKALELGRQMQEDRQKKADKRKKRKGVYRAAGAAAAMLVLVAGVGMSTEANRKVALQAWNAVMESFGFRTATNSVDGEMVVRSKSKEETAAYADISEKLGIGGIDFTYLPEGMEFERYIVDLDLWTATVFYSYQGSLVNVNIINAEKEAVTYLSTDDKTEMIDSFYSKQDIEMEIWGTHMGEMKEEENTYIGEAEYKECRCIINAKMEVDELRTIMEWMYF